MYNGVLPTNLWWPMEGVGIENRLNHDQGLGQVFNIQHVSAITRR